MNQTQRNYDYGAAPYNPEELQFMKDVLPRGFSNGFSSSRNGKQVIATFATFALRDIDSAMDPSSNWQKYELARSAYRHYQQKQEGVRFSKKKLAKWFAEIWRDKQRARRIGQVNPIDEEQIEDLERALNEAFMVQPDISDEI